MNRDFDWCIHLDNRRALDTHKIEREAASFCFPVLCIAVPKWRPHKNQHQPVTICIWRWRFIKSKSNRHSYFYSIALSTLTLTSHNAHTWYFLESLVTVRRGRPVYTHRHHDVYNWMQFYRVPHKRTRLRTSHANQYINEYKQQRKWHNCFRWFPILLILLRSLENGIRLFIYNFTHSEGEGVLHRMTHANYDFYDNTDSIIKLRQNNEKQQ